MGLPGRPSHSWEQPLGTLPVIFSLGKGLGEIEAQGGGKEGDPSPRKRTAFRPGDGTSPGRGKAQARSIVRKKVRAGGGKGTPMTHT